MVFRKLVRRKRFASVLTPHGGYSLDSVWSIFPFWQKIIKRTYHDILAPFLINRSFDGVRAVSEWEKDEMIKKGLDPTKIRVITNGLENEAYLDVDKLASKDIKTKVKSWGKYLIQVGRVYPIKNYETTIQALKKVSSDVNYVIVGPVEENNHPEYWEKLNRLIKDLGLKERVIFVGVIRGVDKYYAIKHAQMMVHMALWESFCNVVHEGLSQGLPCVVANNTALPLLIEDGINGFVVETKNVDALARRINFVLTNRNNKVIKSMRERNFNIGRESSWTNVAMKMDEFYNELSKKIND